MFNSLGLYHPLCRPPMVDNRHCSSPNGPPHLAQPPMFPNVFLESPIHWRQAMQSPLAAFPSPSKYMSSNSPGNQQQKQRSTSTPQSVPSTTCSVLPTATSILFDSLPSASQTTEVKLEKYDCGGRYPPEDTIQSLLSRALAHSSVNTVAIPIKRSPPSSPTKISSPTTLANCSEPEQVRSCPEAPVSHKSPSVESLVGSTGQDTSFVDRDEEMFPYEREDGSSMTEEDTNQNDDDEEDYSQLVRAEPNTEGLFFCHLCDFTGSNREDFTRHMSQHYEYQCPQCDYKSRTEGRLKRHIKDFHSEVPPENFSGKPSVRSGRPKLHRCKQCPFVAQDKVDFWAHARTHIKEDKILECPKCEFVTEYKHHLEYHIRNHFGSKPFKCSKCNYQCVNKSMLNSHMKSHTNVYQYRCLECNYATKYCHSLKQHLKKYQHRPATILNADGSLPDPDTAQELLNVRLGTSKVVSSQQQQQQIHQPPQQISLSASSFLPPGWPPLPPHHPFFGNFPPLLRPPQLPSFAPRLPLNDIPLDLTSKPVGGRTSSLSEQSSGSPELSFTTTKPHFKKRIIEQLSEVRSCSSDDLRCRFCAIRFEDPLMFDIHMGFHGYDRPFRCNRCGVEAQDKMEFFIHLNRSAHP